MAIIGNTPNTGMLSCDEISVNEETTNIPDGIHLAWILIFSVGVVCVRI